MKIQTIQARDFLALRDVTIGVDGAVTVISGDNGAGKSSVFKALMAALCGKGAVPPEPVRHGAEDAEITVTTDDGFVVTAQIKPDRTYRVKVTSEELSVKAPATWLSEKFGGLDALSFLGLDAKKQADTIREIAGVDTSGLDRQEAALRETRRDIGVRGKERAAVADEAPTYEVEPGDIAELEREIADSRSRNRVALELATRRQTAEETLAKTPDPGAEPDIQGADRAVRELEERLRVARDEYATAYAAHTEWKRATDRRAEAQQVLASTPEIVLADVELLEERVQKLKANAEAESKQAAAAKLRSEYEEKTKEIRAIETQRAEMLAAATFPVDGLGFSLDGGLTLGGVPFEQASQAQRMRVSLAVAMSRTPAPPMLFISDASLLDSKSLAAVREMAEARDVQVMLERVGSEPGSVVIEGGRVVG